MAFFTSTFQFYGFVAIISAVLFQCCGGKKKKKTINKKGKKRTEATTKGKPAAAKKPADLRASTAAVVPSFYYKNNVDEKQSRWGAKTIEGSGHQGSISLDKLRADVLKSDQITKEKTLSHMPKSSEGYGGKFGIQADRQDKSAAGWQEREQVAKHASQTDYKKGFGGQFGIEADRQDKSAAGWEEHEQVAKHASQTDYKKGFGGQFGVQSDRQDKSAAGWQEHEHVAKHASQTDYKKGFGGQFGIQTDRKDKLAATWEEREQIAKHASQTDYSIGFGGQFGVQDDHMDKSAVGWNEGPSRNQKQMQPIDGLNKGGANSLRKKFEQLAMQGDQQNVERAREERERRKLEDEELRKKRAEEEEQRQKRLDQQPIEQNILQQQPQQPKIRPSIGVRLPFAAATAPVPTPEIEKQRSISTDHSTQIEQQLPEEYPPPVQVLPTVDGGHIFGASVAAHALLMHKRKSTEVNTEWEQELNQSLLQQQTAPKDIQMPEPNALIQNKDQTKTELSIECEEPERLQSHQYEMPPMEVNVQKQQLSNSAINAEESNPPADPTPPSGILFTRELSALALYEYERQDDDEISFDVNDLITDIEQIDTGWWRGCCNGQYGLFPANYVQLIER